MWQNTLQIEKEKPVSFFWMLLLRSYPEFFPALRCLSPLNFRSRNSEFHSRFSPFISIRNEFSLLPFIFILIPLRPKNSNIRTLPCSNTSGAKEKIICSWIGEKRGKKSQYFLCGFIKTLKEISIFVYF